jgi:hypothetical protein
MLLEREFDRENVTMEKKEEGTRTIESGRQIDLL